MLKAEIINIDTIDFAELYRQQIKTSGRKPIPVSNWDDIPLCDIVIASRSTLIDEPYKALTKLNEKACLRVYTTHIVDPYFTDPALLALIGHQPEVLPNYIYAINILY